MDDNTSRLYLAYLGGSNDNVTIRRTREPLLSRPAMLILFVVGSFPFGGGGTSFLAATVVAKNDGAEEDDFGRPSADVEEVEEDGDDSISSPLAIMSKKRVLDVKLRPRQWRVASKGFVRRGMAEHRTADIHTTCQTHTNGVIGG